MKCNNCNSEWNTVAAVSSCPFCGKSLVKEEEPKSYENSKDALAAIMGKHGPDVLLGEKLKAFFADYAPSVPQNQKGLVYAVYEKGAAKVLKSNLNASQADKEIAVKIAVRNLTDAFIVQDMAESIIYEFTAALGWQVNRPEPVPPPAPTLAPATVTPAACPVPDNMVQIPAGTFMMGSPANEPERSAEEGPQHQVTISSFYMGKYEVTQKEYQEVMGTNPSKFKGDNLPVEQVSWYEVIEYCNRRSQREGLAPAYTVNGKDVTWNRNANGYRLPTEAEWEYACRAGTTTAYNTGAKISDKTGWYDNNSGNRTHTVGEKPANAWGLYDMHGNVWEWCWDWYGDYSSGAQTDPVGAVSGNNRVLRGGSWYNDGQYLRSAYRGSNVPHVRNRLIGFRLVRP